MKRLLSFILLTAFISWLLLLATPTRSASACRCGKISTVEEEMEQADIIFSGRVVAVDSDTMRGKAKFMVSQVWRGSVPPMITTCNLVACVDVFREGEEYLVFARDVREEETIAKLGYRYFAKRCGQTNPLKVSEAILGFLGPGSAPRPFAPEESELKEESLKKEIVLLLTGGGIIGALLLLLVRKIRKSGYA